MSRGERLERVIDTARAAGGAVLEVYGTQFDIWSKADGSPMTMDDLLAAMRAGGLYVNVHTASNKSGEVRGQIKP